MKAPNVGRLFAFVIGLFAGVLICQDNLWAIVIAASATLILGVLD